MSKIKIGKISITYAGEWDQSQTYSVNTCVLYSGSSYVTLKQLKGIVPINDGINYRLMASKGQKGAKGVDGTVSFSSLTSSQKESLKGQKGDTGTTFTPNVSQEGVLTWSNNGDLQNPTAIDLKGPKGDKGNPGQLFYLKINQTGQLCMYVMDQKYSDLLRIDQDGNLCMKVEDGTTTNVPSESSSSDVSS